VAQACNLRLLNAEAERMRFFSNLEFYAKDTRLGPRIQTKRHLWTLGAYLLLSLGIFARQIIDFPTIRFVSSQANAAVLGASFIVGLAIFPPAMRWINSRRSVPGLEHLLAPFTIGFFLNLAMKLILKGWLV
jgi:hypothetical protein